MIPANKSPADRLQEDLGTPVYSEADIIRTVLLRLRQKRPCSLLLAQSMKLTSVTFPSTLVGLIVRAAPGVIVTSDGPEAAFRVATQRAILRGLTLRTRYEGAVGIEVSDGADFVTIDGVDFKVRANVAGEGYFAKAISVTGAVTIDLKVLECNFQTERGVVVESGASLSGGTVRGCARQTASAVFTAASPFNSVGGGPDYIDNRDMSVDVSAGSTSNGGRVIGNHSCDITVGANCGHVAIVGNDGSFTIDTSASSGNNRLAGNKPLSASSKTLHASDHDADGFGTTHATLNSADPTVTVNGATYLRLLFGAGSSGSVSIADGAFTGHRLTLFCVSYAGSASLPDNTAQNVKLSAAWTPTADDTLTLIWDATDGNWIEVARSAN